VDIHPSGKNKLTVGIYFAATDAIKFSDGGYTAFVYGEVPV
jgi:hypothetical protein